MKLLLVRHAKAEDLAPGQSDDARRLTGSGRQTARHIGRALKHLLPRVDLLVTSPCARACETAKHIARAYNRLDATPLTDLRPGAAPDAVLAWLQEQSSEAMIVLVGHEPDLGGLASWLLTGDTRPVLAFKKGAACLIAFDDRPAPAGGQLEWYVPPRLLRGSGR
jgi:phosphohistidine phosphatase